MKRAKFLNWMYAIVAVGMLGVLNACDPKTDDDTDTDDKTGDVIEIRGELSGTENWEAKNTYLLKGFVYVTDGAILNIEPGTVIKGDKDTKGTLVVERGGRINAQGTKDKPIVFTSNQPAGSRTYGDWGGIVLCGRAAVNSTSGTATIEGGIRSEYGGGSNPVNDDNSGVLSYVRIEFCGIEYATDNEINGLTMGGVGSGTTLDHIQISYSGDDSFEMFGGSVNAKYLVAYRGWDDDFDTDNGYSGKLQFLVSLRDPNVADKSESNGFESDNDSKGSTNAPFTNPTFSNVSLFGPYTNITDVVNPTGGSSTGLFKSGIHLRRNTKLSMYNSVIAGWPYGVRIENGGKGTAQQNATDGYLVLANNIVAGSGIQNFHEDKVAYDETQQFVQSYWNREGASNLSLETVAALGLKNPFSLSAPGFTALTTSSAVYGKASFEHAEVSGSFFDKVNFIGAFGTEDWTAGWCNFDPQNTEY